LRILQNRAALRGQLPLAGSDTARDDRQRGQQTQCDASHDSSSDARLADTGRSAQQYSHDRH
jgi:hypothetical protein